MKVRDAIVDIMILGGLALFFSAIYEIDPLLARAGLGAVLFIGGAVGAWRRAA